MVILDTDHVSLAFWGRGPDADNVRRRVSSFPASQVNASIISYEEQTRGWLVFAAKAKTTAQQVEAYRRLETHLELYKQIPIVGFTSAAAVHFQRLRKLVRIGTMDLKIASIALAHGATVITRNLADFRQVPDLVIEDWTK